MFSKPSIFLCLPGISFELYMCFIAAVDNILITRLLFPLPDTPVTQVYVPSGNLTSIFLRLFSQAPLTSINFPVPRLLSFGTSIFSLPLKYLPVILSSLAITSSGVPLATIYPPASPAPGPTSTK